MKTKLLLAIAVMAISPLFLNSQELCIQNAWDAYNKGKYKEAINFAEQCIEDFDIKASNIQSELDSLKITPQTGSVNAIQKERIFKNSHLNDVATACFIKGRSAEYIYKQDQKNNIAYKQTAIEAYTLSCKYSKGRCWDPQGFFWSPCESSSERLQKLK